MIVIKIPLNTLGEGEKFTTRITRADGTVLKTGNKEYQVALTYPNGAKVEKTVRSELLVNA